MNKLPGRPKILLTENIQRSRIIVCDDILWNRFKKKHSNVSRTLRGFMLKDLLEEGTI